MSTQTNEDPALSPELMSSAARNAERMMGIKATMDKVLDLDEVMSSARLAERVVRICLRADLEAEYYDLQEELGDLVDASGKLLVDEDAESAIGEQSRATWISERLPVLQAEMREASRAARFRAMPESAFSAFERAHRDKDDRMKDPEDYANRLIVETAIAPTMTIDQIRAMRDKLGHSQIQSMANAAYSACTTGGLDVPKLPSFLLSLKPLGS